MLCFLQVWSVGELNLGYMCPEWVGSAAAWCGMGLTSSVLWDWDLNASGLEALGRSHPPADGNVSQVVSSWSGIPLKLQECPREDD